MEMLPGAQIGYMPGGHLHVCICLSACHVILPKLAARGQFQLYQLHVISGQCKGRQSSSLISGSLNDAAV